MIVFGAIIMGLWLIFLVYWFVSGLSVKRSVGGTLWRSAASRVAFGLGIVLLVREVFREHAWQQVPHAVSTTRFIEASLGVAICAIGIGIAIWARVYLGRNWGMPMSLREGHELVTSGPYAIVRHPIYTGILLAAAGTMLVQWFPWVVILGLSFAYFVYAAKTEERSMIGQFQNEYPGYMRRTKMLIPFVL